MKKYLRILSAVSIVCMVLTALLCLSSCSILEFLAPPSETPPVSSTESGCHHDYGAPTVEKEPTCTEEGLSVSVCKKCGAKKEEPIPALGHLEVPCEELPASCFTCGRTGGTYCKRCNKILTEPTPTDPVGHTFKNGVCIRCGASECIRTEDEYLELTGTQYGYDALGQRKNGAAMQEFYTRVEAAIKDFHKNPSKNAVKKQDQYKMTELRFDDLHLSSDDAMSVLCVFLNDHPIYYWVSNSVRYSAKTLQINVLEPYASGKDRTAQNAEIYKALAAYSSLLPPNADCYQKTLILHDAILDAIDYAFDESGNPQDAHWAHSIIGVFSKKGAVCEGFAEAYQVLLRLNGVNSILVTGTGGGENHAWNQVELYGKWYGIDITWDDNNLKTYPYLYFCLSEQEFSKRHTPASPDGVGFEYLYPLPKLHNRNLEWVKLFRNSHEIGIFPSIDDALEQIDQFGDYSILLAPFKTSGNVRIHTPVRFHIYGEFPATQRITINGHHEIHSDGTFSATNVLLTKDTVLNSELFLFDLFLCSDDPVTLHKNGHWINARPDTSTFSDILDKITVSK